VAAFLARRIRFLEIVEIVQRVLDGYQTKKIRTLDDVFEEDRLMREQAKHLIQQRN
jgi:1-deoxy-D-xylulose 5-phosphate reductoisomerase